MLISFENLMDGIIASCSPRSLSEVEWPCPAYETFKKECEKQTPVLELYNKVLYESSKNINKLVRHPVASLSFMIIKCSGLSV